MTTINPPVPRPPRKPLVRGPDRGPPDIDPSEISEQAQHVRSFSAPEEMVAELDYGRDMRTLQGKRVAILATDGVEQDELDIPLRKLEAVGVIVTIISPQLHEIQGFSHGEKDQVFPVHATLAHADAQEYDALILPGGVMNPDKLRTNEDAIKLIQDFDAADKCIAAICHGPILLSEANILEGINVTSYPSIKTDLENAGAAWHDGKVVQDWNIITSRNPEDVNAFSAAIISYLKE